MKTKVSDLHKNKQKNYRVIQNKETKREDRKEEKNS